MVKTKITNYIYIVKSTYDSYKSFNLDNKLSIRGRYSVNTSNEPMSFKSRVSAEFFNYNK